MLGAIGLGLVRGFTRNIKEEKLRRIADQEKVDLYEQMMIKSSLENENMTPAAIAFMGGAIKNARGKLDEREAIDMFGTQSKALDMDFTQDLPMIRALMKQPEQEEKEFQVPYDNYFQATERDEKGELHKDGYFGIPFKLDTLSETQAAGVLDWATRGTLQSESAQQMFKKYPSLAAQVRDYVISAAGMVSYGTEKQSIKEGMELTSESGPALTNALKAVNDFVVPFIQVDGVGASVAGANVAESQKRGENVDTAISIGDGVIQKFALDDNARANMQMAADSFGVSLEEFPTYIQKELYDHPMNVFANNGTVQAQLIGATMSFVADASQMDVNPSAVLDPTSGVVIQDENVYLKLSDALDNKVKGIGNAGQLTFSKKVNILAPLMQVQSGDKKLGGKYASTVKKDTRTNADYALTLIPGGTKGKTDKEISAQFYAVSRTIEELDQAMAAREEFGSVFVRRIAKAYSWAKEVVGDAGAELFVSTAEAGNWYSGEIDSNRTLVAGDSYVTSSYVDSKLAAAKKKGEAYAQFEAVKISLAFQLARAADPAGRLSNQDIEQQMVQLGDIFDSKETTMVKLNLIKDRLMKQKPKLQALNTLLSNNNRVSLATMAAAEATMAVVNLDARTARLRQGSRGGNLEADYSLSPSRTFDANIRVDKNGVTFTENGQTVYFDADGNRMTQRPTQRSTASPAPAGQTQQPQAAASPQPAPSSSGVGYDASEVTPTPGVGNNATGFELTLQGSNQPLQGRFTWNGSKWIAK